MKRPNVNILYICVIFALITLFSCKGKGGTYRDGVFYPNDEKLAGSKKVTKPDGNEYIMFYNRDGTPQSGEGMHHPTCKKCKQLEKEGYYEHQFILKDGKNIHDPNCSVCKEWNN